MIVTKVSFPLIQAQSLTDSKILLSQSLADESRRQKQEYLRMGVYAKSKLINMRASARQLLVDNREHISSTRIAAYS